MNLGEILAELAGTVAFAASTGSRSSDNEGSRTVSKEDVPVVSDYRYP